MKKITLALTLLVGLALNAQIYYQIPALAGNPGGYNTPADDEQPVVAGSTVILPSTTSVVWSANQTIPFTFQFNGITETSYKVSTTGVLTFTTSATSVPTANPATIPSSSIPDKSIMVWGIEGVGSNDNIATKVYGTAPNRQLWIMFLSYTVRGGSGSNWSYYSIVLEEGTNAIHFVDQRINAGNGTDGVTMGVQVNGTTAYSVPGSPNLAHLSGDLPDETDNWHYTFMPGPQPALDMMGTEVLLTDYLLMPNAPFTVAAKFFNLGTTTITSATINYSANGGTPVSAPLTGLNIASFDNVTLTHPTAWNPTPNSYNVEVWLSNLNGSADANPSNDKADKTVSVVANATTRTSLYETFTSSTCPPCVPGNINTENIFAANPGEYASVKYQMSWPGNGDPYFTNEGNARRNFYGINSVPWLMLDGGWDGNSNSLTQTVFDQYQNIPAFVDLTAEYHVTGQGIAVGVSIDPVATISSSNMKVFVAVIEKETDGNVGTNGETEFIHVFKKMLPNENGDAIPGFVAGQNITKFYTYVFNGSYRLPSNANDPINNATEHSVEDFGDLSVIVWIQDVVTKEVYQAAEGSLVLGVDDFDAAAYNLKLYPNPANDFTSLSIEMDQAAIANISVVNTLGQTVLNTSEKLESGTSKVSLNTSEFAAGVYFVNVEIEGALQTLKLTVR